MALDPLDVRYFKLAVGAVRAETPQDVAARCPICGDSKHSNKARLHLYQKGDLTLVNCFNGGCPCSNRTMYTFLRDFYPNLFSNYKKERFKRALGDDHKGLEDMVIDLGCHGASPKVERAQEPKVEQEAQPAPDGISLRQFFAPLSEAGHRYLDSRGITDHKQVFTAASNAFLDGKSFPIKDFLIVPLIKGKEIYGFYTRSTKEKRFYTYIKHNYIGFKAWNLFRVNPDEPVYIFEGIFDAMAAQQCGLTNSIALMGAKPSSEIMALLKKPVFCLDNDGTGIRNALEYCSKYPVVVWPFDEPKDANEMLLKGVDLYNTITQNIKTGIRALVALKAKL